jgi:hypothetical protein
MTKKMTISELIEILDAIDVDLFAKDLFVEVNAVGNLRVSDEDDRYVGYIDFREKSFET